MPDTDYRQRAVALENELRSLQEEWHTPRQGSSTAEPKLRVEDAQRLKRIVDDFRLFLWAYIEAWSPARGDAGGSLQRIRLQAVADMVNVLRTQLAGKGLPDTPEARAVRRAVMDFTQSVL